MSKGSMVGSNEKKDQTLMNEIYMRIDRMASANVI